MLRTHAGRPLVLMQGAGASKTVWQLDLLRSLAQGREVVVFDFRCCLCGGTPSAHESFSPTSVAAAGEQESQQTPLLASTRLLNMPASPEDMSDHSTSAKHGLTWAHMPCRLDSGALGCAVHHRRRPVHASGPTVRPQCLTALAYWLCPSDLHESTHLASALASTSYSAA